MAIMIRVPLAHRWLRRAALSGAAGLVLSACAGTAKDSFQDVAEATLGANNALHNPLSEKTAVALTKSTGATISAAAKPVDEAGLKGAIDRYARAKRQLTGTYVQAGADLRGNGQVQALVLFTSENWCQPQGCSLVVFEQSSTGSGYRLVATINRVRAPIVVSANKTAGWRDIWVKTGRDITLAKLPLQNARLQFGANGYPSSASFATTAVLGATDAAAFGTPDGEALIQSADLTVPEKAKIAGMPPRGDANEKKKK